LRFCVEGDSFTEALQEGVAFNESNFADAAKRPFGSTGDTLEGTKIARVWWRGIGNQDFGSQISKDNRMISISAPGSKSSAPVADFKARKEKLVRPGRARASVTFSFCQRECPADEII
jgi:hypothetical protein